MNKIRTFAELAQIVDRSGKTLLRYPEHATNTVALATTHIVSLIQKPATFDVVRDIVNHTRSLASDLTHATKLKWSANELYLDRDISEWWIGANASREGDLNETEERETLKALEESGYNVINVEYGSEIHSRWNEVYVED